MRDTELYATLLGLTPPWEVPRVNCPKCGVKQVRVAWAEDGSRFTELFEAFAIQVLQAVRSKVQAQSLIGGGHDLELRRIVTTVASSTSVAHHGCHFFEQGAKAVDRGTVVKHTSLGALELQISTTGHDVRVCLR